VLRYLANNDIDKLQWDACIDDAVNAMPYAYSWYLDIVTMGKWDAIVIDNYQAVFPVPVKSFLLYKKVYQPFFVQQLGLFVRQEKYFSMLQDCVQLLQEKQKNIYLHLNTANELPGAKKRLTHLLSLHEEYALIAAEYGTAVKKNLKLSAKQLITISNAINVTSFVTFIKRYVGDKAKELKEKDFQTLEQLIEICMKKDKGFLCCAKNTSGEVLSAVFFLHAKHSLIYLVAGSSQQGRKLQAMTLLLDNVIRQFAHTHTILDFEGSMIPGIAHFYKSFGGKEITFPVLIK